MRLIDIQLVYDVVTSMQDRPRGSRRRAAERHHVVPATVTAAFARMEVAMGACLVRRESGSTRLTLTPQGHAFARFGGEFLHSFQLLRRFVQDARDPQNVDIQNN